MNECGNECKPRLPVILKLYSARKNSPRSLLRFTPLTLDGTLAPDCPCPGVFLDAVVWKSYLEQLWHRYQAFWNKDRNRTLENSSPFIFPCSVAKGSLLPVPSSGTMNSVFLGRVQSTLRQWNAPTSQAEGLPLLFNLGGD